MGKIVLVTGGARSGKSRFAESYAAKHGKHVAYIATAEVLIHGLERGDLDDAAITIPAGELTINDNTLALAGDDEAVVTGSSITGLADNASLTVGAAGTYTFASDDDTQTMKVDIGDVILVDKDGAISVYDPSDFNLNGESTTDQIIRQLTNNPSGPIDRDYSNDSATPLEEYDSATADGNLVYDLDDGEDADFSSDTGKKKVTLEGGEQTLTFNDEGGNIAVDRKSVV